jgi:hypothetical protein
MKKYNFKSKLEEIAVEKFGKKLLYEYEKIKVNEVPNFPSLGKIVALRFIEWLGLNLFDIFPDGMVDLTLRYRMPKNEIEEKQKEAIYNIDRYAMENEKKIEELGGIGFFLGV